MHETMSVTSAAKVMNIGKIRPPFSRQKTFTFLSIEGLTTISGWKIVKQHTQISNDEKKREKEGIS